MTPTFIWDLDGTLLDSYEAILAGIQETYEQFGLPFDREEVRNFILRYSVKDLLVRVKFWTGQQRKEFKISFIHTRVTMLFRFWRIWVSVNISQKS